MCSGITAWSGQEDLGNSPSDLDILFELTEVPQDTPELLAAHPIGPPTVLAAERKIFAHIPGLKPDDRFFLALFTVKAIIEMEHRLIIG
jgi:hypothetical protein